MIRGLLAVVLLAIASPCFATTQAEAEDARDDATLASNVAWNAYTPVQFVEIWGTDRQISYFEEANDLMGIASFQMGQGIADLNQSNWGAAEAHFRQAEEWFDDALENYQAIGPPPGQ